jgi:hypothetical protein
MDREYSVLYIVCLYMYFLNIVLVLNHVTLLPVSPKKPLTSKYLVSLMESPTFVSNYLSFPTIKVCPLGV